MMDGTWHGFTGGGFMWLFWLIVIGLVIYIVMQMSGRRDDRNPDKPQSGSDDAMDILKRRYAEGEIDEAEFERRKKELLKD